MTHSVGNYTLARKIKDPQFSVDHIDQYDLLLLAGQHDFQFGVVDTQQQRCLLVEDYTFSDSATDSDGNVYRSVIEDHQLLMAGYWNRVKLAVKSQHFTLVPEDYFSPEHASHYLTLVTETPADKYTITYQPHKQANAVMVFGAQRQLVERLRSTYPSQDVQLLYQGSVFIEGVQRSTDSSDRAMHLHIGRQHVLMLVLEDQKIILYNRFVYATSNDIVKYTLTALQKLDMNQNGAKVTVWGNIPKQSKQYATLYKYVRNLSYGTMPNFLKFSHVFDEAPEHQYFDLYSMDLSE